MEKEWKEGKKRKGEKKGDDRLEFRGEGSLRHCF